MPPRGLEKRQEVDVLNRGASILRCGNLNFDTFAAQRAKSVSSHDNDPHGAIDVYSSLLVPSRAQYARVSFIPVGTLRWGMTTMANTLS